jgi:hypothetical protein
MKRVGFYGRFVRILGIAPVRMPQRLRTAGSVKPGAARRRSRPSVMGRARRLACMLIWSRTRGENVR